MEDQQLEAVVMALLDRVQIGDWVLASYVKAEPRRNPCVLLRRIASGPEFERDERHHATAELWIMDDGTAIDRRQLVKVPLRDLVQRAAELAHRMRAALPVPPTDGTEAQRQLKLIEDSYPQHHARHEDMHAAVTVYTELSAAIVARRKFPEAMRNLATSLGWAGICCMADRNGGRKAFAVARAALMAQLGDTGSTGDAWDSGYNAGLRFAIQNIDNLLETKGDESEQQRGSQGIDGGGSRGIQGDHAGNLRGGSEGGDWGSGPN